MSAKYWVARYVEDVFRDEPKNVGVVVAVDGGGLAAKFAGERDDGKLDRHKLAGTFAHPSVYIQWHEYWRNEIDKGNIAEIVEAKTSNYFVSQGGEVSDIGTDTAVEVCQFLFSALVSGGVHEATAEIERLREALKQEQEKFQLETLRTSECSALLRRWIARPRPGSLRSHQAVDVEVKIYEWRELVDDSEKLLATPINLGRTQEPKP